MAYNALVKIQMKRASSSDWNRTSDTGSAWKGYLLREGEFGVEIFPDNSVKIKIGNGISTWQQLKYVSADSAHFIPSLIDPSAAEINELYIVGDAIYYTKDKINWNKIGGVTDFELLTNRPKYNGSTMNHNTNIPKVPTQASDLSYRNTGTSLIATDVQSAITELSSTLDNKVDKSNQSKIVYGTDSNGTQQEIPYSEAKSTNTIVKRTNYGTIKANTPTENDDATTKGYVDNITGALRQDVDTLSSGMTTVQNRIDSMNTQISGMRTSIDNNRNDIEDLQSTVATQQASITGIQTIVNSHTSSIRDLQGDITSLSGRIDSTQSSISQLNTDLQNEISDRYDNDISSIEINGANNNTLVLTKNNNQTISTNIPIASQTANGLITKESYKQIQDNAQAIEDLKNQGGKFIGVSFATKAELNAYTIPDSVNVGDFTYVIDDEAHLDATTRYICSLNGSSQKEFTFAYVIEYDPIGTATRSTKGIVLASNELGKIDVEIDGTMSLNGYDAIITSLENKVDKVSGKTLTTNDFTNAYKNKVDLILSNGAGNTFLSDDGTYKTIQIPETGVLDVLVDGDSVVDNLGQAQLHKIAGSGSYNDLINVPLDLVRDASYVHTDNNFTNNLKSRVDLITIIGTGNKFLSDDGSYKQLSDIAYSGSWDHLQNVPIDLVYDSNYVHTDNNFTTALRTKLETMQPSGEPNVLEGIELDGTLVPIDTNKIAQLDLSEYAKVIIVPTNTSDLTNDSNFAVDANYVHTDNNFTTELKTKLENISPGGEENVIEEIQLDGTPLSIVNKSVNIALAGTYALAADIPTQVGELMNDMNYQTDTDVATTIAGTNISTFNNDSNYQTGTQVTTAITNAIAGVTQFDYQIVQTLPATGTKGTFYLIASTDPEQQNIYEEYLYINNNWELVGTTKIDLSDYATLEDLGLKVNKAGDTMTGQLKVKINGNSSIKGSQIIAESDNYYGGTSAIELVKNNEGNNPAAWKIDNGLRSLVIYSNMNNEAQAQSTYQGPSLSLDGANKDLTLYGNVLPNTTSSKDLGSQSKVWNKLYVNQILDSNGDDILDALDDYLPLAGGTMTGTINSQNIIPTSDNVYSLGDSSHRIKEYYGRVIKLFNNDPNNTAQIQFGYGTATPSDATSIKTYNTNSLSIYNHGLDVFSVDSTGTFGLKASIGIGNGGRANGISFNNTSGANFIFNKTGLSYLDEALNNARVDQKGFIRTDANGSTIGSIEIATAGCTSDVGWQSAKINQEIYVSQYNSYSSTSTIGVLKNRAKLLNKDGNTELPGSLSLAYDHTTDTAPAKMEYNSTDKCIEFSIAS